MLQYPVLARRRLSVISAEPDAELDGIARTIAASVRVAGRAAFAQLLERLLAASPGGEVAPKTLDLLGHSTASAGLLRLGDWVIDAACPTVAALCRELAATRALPRLGIHGVRLLGCRTAATERGRATMAALAELLGVEVWGTPHLLYDVHYDEHGFRDCWGFMLVRASELGRGERVVRGPRAPRTLDLATLPALPLGPPGDWPRRVATTAAAREILALIRRDAGAPMPGPAAPFCELALPSARPREYHVAHALLEGAFLRFYPDGDAAGIAFPVDDAPALRRILGELPGDVTG